VAVSAKVDYACLAVLALAVEHESGRPVSLRWLAERHGIPSPFLAQIFQQLKTAGLVHSVRGALGGYCLSRPPATIRVWDVVRAVEPPWPQSASAGREPLRAAVRAIWEREATARREILEEIDFAQLVRESVVQAEPMYYI
jgi:Rrf2 family protein